MFKCEVCSYECRFNSNFIRHKQIHEGVRYSCFLCISTFSFRSGFLRHIKNIHGINANRRRYKSQVAAHNHFPDDRTETYVIGVASDSEICVNKFKNKTKDGKMQGIDANHRRCKSRVAAQNNVSLEGVRHSCGICNSTFSFRSNLTRHIKNIHGIDANHRRYKSRVAAQDNEYLHKGTKNQSVSTPKKKCTLRKLHEKYVKAHHSQDKRLVWESNASSLSRKLNLDLQVIEMLMLDIQTDYSVSIDENLVQMLHQDSLFCTESIQHHTQYYIFVQLVYGLMKVYEIDSEDLQSHRKSNWMKNTITILKYFKFTEDTADFMIERMENFI